MGSGIIHMTYYSRVFKWVNFKDIVLRWLHQKELLEEVDRAEMITFGWHHMPSIAGLMYLPKSIFCNFEIANLLVDTYTCACSHKRWLTFLDQETCQTTTELSRPHVWTADLDCIQDNKLWETMACGLNHTPLCQTLLSKAVEEVQVSWARIADILKLDKMLTTKGSSWVEAMVWRDLNQATHKKKGGFKISATGNLNQRALDKLQYLTKHFYISGIDQANNSIANM